MIIMIKGSWYRVPESILTDKDLTLADAAAFAYIADKADGESAALSAAQIAAETGYSLRTIKSAVRKLSERHYIAVEHRAGSSSIYKQLVMPAKRRRASRASKAPEKDMSKYEVVINQFDEPVKGKKEVSA